MARIQDSAFRRVTGVNGEAFGTDTTTVNGPTSLFYWFNGMQVGDVTNNGTDDVDYVTSIARHPATPPQNYGYFRGGDIHGSAYADFDGSYGAKSMADLNWTRATLSTSWASEDEKRRMSIA